MSPTELVTQYINRENVYPGEKVGYKSPITGKVFWAQRFTIEPFPGAYPAYTQLTAALHDNGLDMTVLPPRRGCWEFTVHPKITQ
jgi:hypothetical protein